MRSPMTPVRVLGLGGMLTASGPLTDERGFDTAWRMCYTCRTTIQQGGTIMWTKQQEQMEDEWQAWRTLCGCLEDKGIDLDDEDRLTGAIKLWGEELHRLRKGQPEAIAKKAYAEARELGHA